MKKKEARELLKKVYRANRRILKFMESEDFQEESAEEDNTEDVVIGNMSADEAKDIVEEVGYVRKSDMLTNHWHVTIADCRSKLLGTGMNWERLGDSVRKAKITIKFME